MKSSKGRWVDTTYKNKESDVKEDDDWGPWWKEKKNAEWYGGESWYQEETENQKEHDEFMALKLQKEEYDKSGRRSGKRSRSSDRTLRKRHPQ